MKYITLIAACRRLPLACVLIGTLGLASCGGGSTAVAAPSNIVASFLDIIRGINFPWSTAQQVQVGIGLSRASGAALGDLTVSLSNYFCDDPTGGGGKLASPVRTSAYTSYILDSDQQKAKAAKFDLAGLALQVPAATSYVLVEVYDGASNVMLYGNLVAPAALSTLNISVPIEPVVASCANPG